MDPVPLYIAQLQAAFEKALPGTAAHARMAGRKLTPPTDIASDARDSAVLVLLQEGKSGPEVTLIERTADRSAHSGQIAFPGGRHEPEDVDLLHTALREAAEEVALEANTVAIVGALTVLYIPVSRFYVYPFVAYAPGPLNLRPSPLEVSRIIQTPLSTLFAPQNRIIAEIKPVLTPEQTLQVPAYKLPDDGALVWGATAMILSELQTLLSYG